MLSDLIIVIIKGDQKLKRLILLIGCLVSFIYTSIIFTQTSTEINNSNDKSLIKFSANPENTQGKPNTVVVHFSDSNLEQAVREERQAMEVNYEQAGGDNKGSARVSG